VSTNPFVVIQQDLKLGTEKILLASLEILR